MRRNALALAAVLLAACGGGDEPVEPGWTRLDNGLRYRVVPIEGAKDVAVLTSFSIGGDHDPVGRSGFAHLAEHLYVTAAAAETPARTAAEWAAHVPNGSSAAFTFRRSTICATVVAPERLDTELAEAAARMSALRVEQSDLDRERPRVLAEVENADRSGPSADGLHFAIVDRLCRPANGGRTVGVRADLEKLSLDELRDRLRRNYRPINARLVVAGAVDAAAAGALIARRFGALEPGERVTRPDDDGPELPGQVELGLPIPAGVGRERRLYVAYPSPSPSDPDFPAFLLFQRRAILDVDATAEFFPIWAEPVHGNRYLAYLWMLDQKTVEYGLERLDKTIERCADHAPSDEEMQILRQGWMHVLDLAPTTQSVDDTEVVFRAREIEMGLDRGRLGAALAALTSDDLRRFAGKWLTPEHRVVVVTWVPTEVRVVLRWDEASQTTRRTLGGSEYVKDDELQAAIAAAYAAWVERRKPDAPVVIDADPRIPWTDVIAVVNAIKRAGIEKIEFAMGAPKRDAK